MQPTQTQSMTCPRIFWKKNFQPTEEGVKQQCFWLVCFVALTLPAARLGVQKAHREHTSSAMNGFTRETKKTDRAKKTSDPDTNPKSREISAAKIYTC